MASSDRWRSGAWRALRTFLQAFLASVLAGPLQLANIGTLRAAGLAGVAAVLALVMRWLDGTDFPTPPAG